MDRLGGHPHDLSATDGQWPPSPQNTGSFMRRFLTMLGFTACLIPAAGCSVIRDGGEPPGPLVCDPPEFTSPHLAGLALGPSEDIEVYSTASLTGAAPPPEMPQLVMHL